MTASWLTGRSRWWEVGAVGTLVVLAASTVCCGQPVNASAETAATSPALPAPPPDPYVAVCISERLFRPYSVPIRTLTAVDEVILEMRFRGEAQTNGAVSLDFAPADQDAALALVIRGRSFTKATGQRSSAVIQSTATTRFSATKTILFGMEQGFSTLPAHVTASTDCTVEAVDAVVSGFRGVVAKRVASTKSVHSREEAVAEAGERAQLLIVAAVDKAVQDALDILNDGLYVIEPAIREFRRVNERVLHVSTNETQLQICMRHADALGKPQLPVDAVEPHLVQVWLHAALWPNRDQAEFVRQWARVKPSVGKFIRAMLPEDSNISAADLINEVVLVDVQQVGDWVRIGVDVELGALRRLSHRGPRASSPMARSER